MNQYLFSVWLLLPTVVISTSSTLSELFSQLDNNNTHTIQSDIINNEYNSVLCWLETINFVKYSNETHTTDRQFSIILESPGNLSNTSIDKNGSNDETKKSKVHKFSTLYRGKNFTMRVNKTLLCGSSKVITKEYTRWASNKQRIQINLGTEKLLEKYNLKINNTKVNLAENKVDINNKTSDMNIGKDKLFPRPNVENLTNEICNDTENLTKAVNYNKRNGRSKVKKSIKSGAPEENNINNRQADITNLQETITNHKYIIPLNCNLQHKISVRVHLIVEHLIVDKVYNTEYGKIPLESVEKRQDFNIKLAQKPKFKANEGDINKCWERLVRLLSREYIMEYFDVVIPFIELPSSNIEGSTNSFGEVITFNEEARQHLRTAQKYMQECGRQQEDRK